MYINKLLGEDRRLNSMTNRNIDNSEIEINVPLNMNFAKLYMYFHCFEFFTNKLKGHYILDDIFVALRVSLMSTKIKMVLN